MRRLRELWEDERYEAHRLALGVSVLVAALFWASWTPAYVKPTHAVQVVESEALVKWRAAREAARVDELRAQLALESDRWFMANSRFEMDLDTASNESVRQLERQNELLQQILVELQFAQLYSQTEHRWHK